MRLWRRWRTLIDISGSQMVNYEYNKESELYYCYIDEGGRCLHSNMISKLLIVMNLWIVICATSLACGYAECYSLSDFVDSGLFPN